MTQSSKKVRRGSVLLTEKQDKVVEGVLNGKSKRQAVKDAGLSPTSSHVVTTNPDVQRALSEARSNLAKATAMTRPQVLEMFEEAFDMAKLASEPSSMVAAAREIGKMLGYYEPETVKVELSMAQARLQSKFEAMSDAELLEIAAGKAKVIDGEFTRLS